MTDWNAFIFSDQPFESKACKVFKYQFEHNLVYQRFCKTLGTTPDSLSCHSELVSESAAGEQVLKQAQDDIKHIPLLPVRAFKDAEIITDCKQHSTFNIQHPDLTFKSSGTGDMQRSVHRVADGELYRQSILRGFNHFYDLDNAVILGYTPGYADNPHSSLIWMINELIEQDDIKKSRFLKLNKSLSQGEVDDIAASGRQFIIFGAAFGLLDLIEMSSVTLPSNSIVIETGGMKTHRREMSRKAMHQKLAHAFGIDQSRIHSEYGMCELLSQAYTTGGQWFHCVPWMKVSVHDPNDPQKRLSPYEEGLIGVIDLANVYSCSFLLTGDRGVMDHNGRFQVLGRWNPKDLRGCNFLIEED